MPTPPSWNDQWNFVSFWWANPCDFGLQVYFETGLAALGTLAWQLVAVSPEDVVRGLMRPGSTRQMRHGRKRPKKRGGGAAIPEIGELVADQFSSRELLRNREVNDGVRHLWEVDNWGQKWAYRLMLVDLVADFWYDWNSAIMMHPEAKCPGLERGCRRNAQHVIRPGGWGQIFVPDIVYLEGDLPFGTGSVALGNGDYRIIFTTDVKIYGTAIGNTQVQIGLFQGFAEGDTLDASTRIFLAGTTTRQLVSTASARGPGGVHWLLWCDNEFVEATNVQVIVAKVGES